MTDAERQVWSYLRAHRLHGTLFRRQVPVGCYVVDFVCLAARLIVEIDGGQHASNSKVRDQVRDAWLRSQGFRILQFWNNDVLSNGDGVLEQIVKALAKSPPPSLALPRKGGGNRLRSVGGQS
ncbi:MAG: endonuclease domain-containing protein [Pseudomonadota bacterium]|nr:endonuclease domain-containing protein [Pseudomonadota bacterium]